VVAYTYNPSYVEGGNWEDYGLWPAWAKKVHKTHLNQLLVAVAPVIPSYMRSTDIEESIMVQAG
jgi:hypothetical protein